MNGERLRNAREAAWLTQKALADLSGVSAGTISKIEHGLMASTCDRYAAPLAAATGVPVGYLSDEPLPNFPDGRFRKQSRLSSLARKAVASQAALASGAVHDADELFDMVKVTFKPREDIDNLDEDQVAQELRVAIGAGERQPVGNMTLACERAGIPIVRISLGRGGEGEMDPADRRFSGFSMWPGIGTDKSWRPIVVISSDQDGAVQRSSVAHELAHIYLHTRNPLVPDKEGEEQAWGVAGRLLFPKSAADEVFDGTPVTLDMLRKVKAKYGVSVKFLITYAKRFGYISPDRALSLYKQHTGRGWNKKEPVTVAREKPSFFPAIVRKLESGGCDVNISKGMRDLALSASARRANDTADGAGVISFDKARLLRAK